MSTRHRLRLDAIAALPCAVVAGCAAPASSQPQVPVRVPADPPWDRRLEGEPRVLEGPWGEIRCMRFTVRGGFNDPQDPGLVRRAPESLQ